MPREVQPDLAGPHGNGFLRRRNGVASITTHQTTFDCTVMGFDLVVVRIDVTGAWADPWKPVGDSVLDRQRGDGERY